MIIRPASSPLRGQLTVPGDKSISHRAVMFGSLARGTTEITGFLQSADCLSTIACFSRMGVEIEREGDRVLVHGRGLHGLRRPDTVLDAGNSGTTVRLMSGILAGQSFASEVTGDESICRRPMKRIIDPLTRMGASITSLAGNGCAPLQIQGRPLKGIHYMSPVASAQVKSCILLAGLYADGPVSVTEPILSRDHSERMLRHFGADVTSEGTTARILPDPLLTGRKVPVPGDISSAAYFIAAALLIPGSEVLLKNVGINPTRDGFLQVCRDMGASIDCLNISRDSGEPSADLLVRSSGLKGTMIRGPVIPAMIDELPVAAVLAAFAEGTTVIRDAAELRVKESDRIEGMVDNLRRMGVSAQALEDGMIIHGGHPLHGAEIDPRMDHRLAMSFAVAALAAEGETRILNADCVRISYPDFYQNLKTLRTDS